MGPIPTKRILLIVALLAALVPTAAHQDRAVASQCDQWTCPPSCSASDLVRSIRPDAVTSEVSGQLPSGCQPGSDGASNPRVTVPQQRAPGERPIRVVLVKERTRGGEACTIDETSQLYELDVDPAELAGMEDQLGDVMYEICELAGAPDEQRD